MDDNRLSKKKKKSRVAREEYANREGRWVREFTARTDAWPIVEHWASENGYHLTGMRGPRRLYSKGDNDSGFVTLVDIRQIERRVVLTSWVHVGWLGRLSQLFFIGKEMAMEADGFWGVKPRRRSCQELNALLLRLNQPLILGSEGFHLMDLHGATLSLFVMVAASFAAFLYFALQSLEFRTGLTHRLLQVAGQSGAVLGGAALLFLITHGVLSKRYLPNDWAKAGSSAFFSVALAVIAIMLGTRSGTDVREERVTHHCVAKAEAQRCQEALQLLSPTERAAFRARIENLQKELTYSK